MPTSLSPIESQLTGSERRHLRQARENAYLAATCRDSRRIAKLHGTWCWKLRIPMVWFERLTPRSKFGRVHLDMLTTPSMLNPAGQTALRGLGARFQAAGAIQVTAHDVHWDHVPLGQIDGLCRAALKGAINLDNCQLNRVRPAQEAGAKQETGSKKVLRFVPKEKATA